jgi:hypothetical protein
MKIHDSRDNNDYIVSLDFVGNAATLKWDSFAAKETAPTDQKFFLHDLFSELRAGETTIISINIFERRFLIKKIWEME